MTSELLLRPPSTCLAIAVRTSNDVVMRWFSPDLHIEAEKSGHNFPHDIFQCIFLKENIRVWIKMSLKFLSKSPINNVPSLVQIMAWRRLGDQPLSGQMMVRLPTHICVTRPQWVNGIDGILKLQKRFWMGQTSFEHGSIHYLLLASADMGIYPHLASTYHA